MTGYNKNKEILSGLRVLDFTRVLAGPYATRILADFGAEVIKIQSKKTASGAETNTSGYFNTWNRNKRSVTLDMSYPEAREIFLKLTTISDAVIENFSPRVMSNWGLNYENLKAVRPDLIMVSVSGMGQTGPWRDYVAFGPTIQALSGLTYLSSFDENSPMGLGYAYADVVAGLYAALAVLAALEYRDRDGTGQYIDLSEFEAVGALLGPALLDVLVNHKDILPQGNQPDYMLAAPYGCYKCSGTDRWCAIAVFNEDEWQALLKAMGNPEWAREKKFSTLSNRKKCSRELDELLGEWTIKHEAEEVVCLLQEAGVPAGVVQNAEDLSKDLHLMVRDYFVRLEHPVLGTTISDASPIRFTEGKTGHWKAAPFLGEDNQYVFEDLLGLKDGELSSYIERGIVG
jgi:crotonobetainyl-CoA:carnitine CoA-transferase CaiB-like acyl-CoA transferase